MINCINAYGPWILLFLHHFLLFNDALVWVFMHRRNFALKSGGDKTPVRQDGCIGWARHGFTFRVLSGRKGAKLFVNIWIFSQLYIGSLLSFFM